MLKSLKNLGFAIGENHRLSVFNTSLRFFTLMGTPVDIKAKERSLDVKDYLELATSGDGWMLKILVREPVKYLESPVRACVVQPV